jgi:3',5'-cyclic AMP phosphodiesterase CpdA
MRAFPLLLTLLAMSCSMKPLATVGIVTDLHYNRSKEVRNNRYYTLSAIKLAQAVDTFNKEKVDLVACLGDIIDSDLDSYDDLAAILERLDSPVFKILGNHDFLGPYGSPVQDRVLERLGITRTCFDTCHGKVRLIFLDSNDISVYSRAAGTPERALADSILASLKESGSPLARQYNGTIGAGQLEWLENTLAEAQAKGQTVIVLGHMPLLPDNIKASQWNGRETDSVLQRYSCVKAMLSGHHHHGAEAVSGHIVYHTFKGMIEGPENSFAIVRIYKDKLEIKGFGREGSQTIQYR